MLTWFLLTGALAAQAQAVRPAPKKKATPPATPAKKAAAPVAKPAAKDSTTAVVTDSLGAPNISPIDTTIGPKKALPVKKTVPRATNRQRPGSAPTPPVRYISPDPRDPIGPAPPGTTNPGQKLTPGASHKAVPDTLARPGRTSGIIPTDSSGMSVSGNADSLRLAAKPKGQIQTTVKYTAKDSIQFDVTQKIAKLYSKADVTYGDTNLKAALITVNYGNNTMLADGKLDSLTNRMTDRPVLKDKGGMYTAGSIAYNFKSKKAKVSEAVTSQGEGFVTAETIKRMPNNDLYGLRGRYTTCNLEHPHFYIQASKMKVIPGKQVVTGPFNLVIGDVPTPLGFLFGFFPTPNKSRGSGVLIPTFGQAQDRGYFLTNGGYYFAPNDYIGVRLTGDVYAGNAQQFGGWGGTADVSYLKRYTYQGNFNFRYTNRPSAQILQSGSVTTSPEYITPPSAQTFWISWSHTPTPTPGGGRFSASVQAGSSSYNRTNSLNPRTFLSPTFSSSINYSKQLRNLPINYTLRLAQSQNTQTGVMDFTLPDVSVSVARQYPYEWFKIQPRGRFYEQFTISYQLTAQNRLSNVVPARTLSDLPLLGGSTTPTTIPLSFGSIGRLFSNAQNGMQHQFGIALGSYSLFKNLKLTPSVNYGQVWYGQRLSYSYNTTAQAVRVDTARGFFVAQSYSAGLSANTTFYGLLQVKGKKVEAIRHKVTPSMSYSYSPDYTGVTSVYQNTLPYSDGTGTLTRLNNATNPNYAYSRYNGFVYGGPSGTRASSVSFSLQNSVEMKLRDSKDTTGTNPFRKVSLIDGFDFNTSYNFAADSLKLAPLSVVFRTQIAKKLNLIANATLEPYQRDSIGRTINRYLFDQASNRRLARLSQAGVQMTYQFNPATGKKKSAVPRPVAATNDPTLGTPAGPAYYADYVDFEIPWELNASYSANYTTATVPLQSRLLVPETPILSLSALSVSGSVKLTENLRLGYSTGYDFHSSQATLTNVTFYRDLHCWQITGQWTPFGQYKGYNFTIAAKSSLLQDLKLNRVRNQQLR